MKNKFLKLLVAGLLALVPSLASAQGIVNVGGVQVQPMNIVPVSHSIVAADQSPALYIKYFPPNQGALNTSGTTPTATTTLAVAAGTLTFVVNGAAYTGFECPVSPPLGGIIDNTNAACDTLGEIVDTINSTPASFSTGYFRAVIAAGLRSDPATSGMFKTFAASNAVVRPAGVELDWTAATHISSEVALWDTSLGIAQWINNNKLIRTPFADRDSVLLWAHEKITNAGTIGTFQVYAVKENYVDGGPSSETVRTAFLKAGGATTVAADISEFVNAGGIRGKGEKVFVRLNVTGATTSVFELFCTGYHQFNK